MSKKRWNKNHGQRVRCCYCGEIHVHGPMNDREAGPGDDVGRMARADGHGSWYWFIVNPDEITETHAGTAPRYAQEAKA